MGDRNTLSGCEILPSQFAQKIAAEAEISDFIFEDMIGDLLPWGDTACRRHNGRSGGRKCATIFDLRRLFIPVCENSRWILIMVDFSEEKVLVFDSLNEHGPDQERNLAQRWSMLIMHFVAISYLCDFGEKIDPCRWSRRIVCNTPQQGNGYDCGMFLLMNAEMLAQGKSLNYPSSLVEEKMRMRVACTLASDTPALIKWMS